MRTLRPVVLSSKLMLAFVLLSSPALAGPELDRARRNTAVARAVLDGAERKLRAAEAEQDRLRLEVDRLRDRRRDAERKVDDLRDEQRALPNRIRDLEDKLPRLGRDLDDAQRDLDRELKPLKDAIDREKAAAVKVREQREVYHRLFEKSTVYLDALAAAEAAVRREAELAEAVKARVHATSAYQAAISKYNAARAKLDALKGKPNAELADRAAAATAVIETEKITSRMESDADGSDPQLAEARTTVKRTDAAFKSLIAEFESGLPKEPAMADALTEHDAALRESKRLETIARRSQDKVRTLTQQIDGTKGEVRTLKSRIDDFDKFIAAAKRDVDAVVADLDRAQRAATATASDMTRLRRDVDLAQRRYDDARRFESVAAQRDAANEKSKSK
ncbi:MAG: hypothetical protein WD768_16780 [Phycisphaeraceae bacterium]